MDKFERDLYYVYRRIRENSNAEVVAPLKHLKRQLVKMHKRGLVKINHSTMELVCARHLLEQGYSVDVEHRLNDIIVCDVYGRNLSTRCIVEIETGFIPPDHAVDPRGYVEARTISKIARYSAYSDTFALAMPQMTILPVPDLLLLPPDERKGVDIGALKNLCDMYYTNPPIDEQELRYAKLDRVFYIDVDSCSVFELEPVQYMEFYKQWADVSGMRYGKETSPAPIYRT